MFSNPDTLYVVISIFFAIAAFSVALAVVSVTRVVRRPHGPRPAARRRNTLAAAPAGQMA